MSVRHAAHPDFVLARDAVPRMRQARREIAVARQKQQPLRIEVEPADRIDVAVHAALREQVDHRRPMLADPSGS